MQLQDKIIVVTGGKGLIGKALVDDIRENGGTCICADVSCKTDMTKSEISLDITDEQSVRTLIEAVVKQHGRIDGWVNAAYPRTDDWNTPFENIPVESWRKNIDMQLNGTFICCQAALEQMRKQGSGSLINIASIYGVVGPDFSLYEGTDMTNPAAYAPIKAGIIHLTKYLAAYYGPHGVRVNTVSPGGVLNNQPKKFVTRYEAKTPLGRMATPKDVASGVTFLLSDGASYITGHNLLIDGGWTIA